MLIQYWCNKWQRNCRMYLAEYIHSMCKGHTYRPSSSLIATLSDDEWIRSHRLMLGGPVSTRGTLLASLQTPYTRAMLGCHKHACIPPQLQADLAPCCLAVIHLDNLHATPLALAHRPKPQHPSYAASRNVDPADLPRLDFSHHAVLDCCCCHLTVHLRPSNAHCMLLDKSKACHTRDVSSWKCPTRTPRAAAAVWHCLIVLADASTTPS